ncbi:MAG TPA: hypothetical protein VD866_11045 [Urbifossiella sp.]|nr:hypothetical protein [Urbifossiella sp.]
MRADTFDATIQQFQQRVPYRPFTIVLVNGTQFEVDFPTAITVRDGTGVYVRPGGIPVIFDHEGVNQIFGDLKPEDAG